VRLEISRLEDFIALGKLDPRLLPARPYVPRRPQPRCIVQRAAPDADDTISRHPGNPGAALRANQSGGDASAIDGTLKPTWLNPRQTEPLSFRTGNRLSGGFIDLSYGAPLVIGLHRVEVPMG